MEVINYISAVIGLVGGTLGIISFFREYTGKYKVTLEFDKGDDIYLNKNYIERHTLLIIKIVKFGRVKQSISSAVIESRTIHLEDGDPINLNDQIRINTLTGTSLEQHDVKLFKYDFKDESAIASLLKMMEIRVTITDTRNKMYISDWVRYDKYCTPTEMVNRAFSGI